MVPPDPPYPALSGTGHVPAKGNRLANMEAAQIDIRDHEGTFRDRDRKEIYEGLHPPPEIEF